MKNIDELRNIDITKADKSSLADINEIEIDINSDFEKRREDFIRQIKNPYCFISNGIIVKTKFSENGSRFSDILSEYILNII